MDPTPNFGVFSDFIHAFLTEIDFSIYKYCQNAVCTIFSSCFIVTILYYRKKEKNRHCVLCYSIVLSKSIFNLMIVSV